MKSVAIQIELTHTELMQLMVEKGIVKSNSEWKRLVSQGAIDLMSFTLKVGKRRFVLVK